MSSDLFSSITSQHYRSITGQPTNPVALINSYLERSAQPISKVDERSIGYQKFKRLTQPYDQTLPPVSSEQKYNNSRKLEPQILDSTIKQNFDDTVLNGNSLISPYIIFLLQEETANIARYRTAITNSKVKLNTDFESFSKEIMNLIEDLRLQCQWDIDSYYKSFLQQYQDLKNSANKMRQRWIELKLQKTGEQFDSERDFIGKSQNLVDFLKNQQQTDEQLHIQKALQLQLQDHLSQVQKIGLQLLETMNVVPEFYPQSTIQIHLSTIKDNFAKDLAIQFNAQEPQQKTVETDPDKQWLQSLRNQKYQSTQQATAWPLSTGNRANTHAQKRPESGKHRIDEREKQVDSGETFSMGSVPSTARDAAVQSTEADFRNRGARQNAEQEGAQRSDVYWSENEPPKSLKQPILKLNLENCSPLNTGPLSNASPKSRSARSPKPNLIIENQPSGRSKKSINEGGQDDGLSQGSNLERQNLGRNSPLPQKNPDQSQLGLPDAIRPPGNVQSSDNENSQLNDNSNQTTILANQRIIAMRNNLLVEREWQQEFASEGTLIAEWQLQTSHNDKLLCCCLLDENRIATGSWDNQIHIYNIANLANSEGRTEQPDPDIILTGHQAAITCLLYSEPFLISGCDHPDASIILWNLAENGQSNMQAQLFQHKGAVISILSLGDGQTIVSGSYDSSIVFWDVSNCAISQICDQHSTAVLALQMLQDGSWQFMECLPERTISQVGSVSTMISSLTQENILLVGNNEGQVIILDIESGVALQSQEIGNEMPHIVSLQLLESRSRSSADSQIQQFQLLVLCLENSYVTCIDLTTGEQIQIDTENSINIKFANGIRPLAQLRSTETHRSMISIDQARGRVFAFRLTPALKSLTESEK